MARDDKAKPGRLRLVEGGEGSDPLAEAIAVLLNRLEEAEDANPNLVYVRVPIEEMVAFRDAIDNLEE